MRRQIAEEKRKIEIQELIRVYSSQELALMVLNNAARIADLQDELNRVSRELIIAQADLGATKKVGG